jgi:hypothetical protein
MNTRLIIAVFVSDSPVASQAPPDSDADIWPPLSEEPISKEGDERNPWLEEWFASGGTASVTPGTTGGAAATGEDPLVEPRDDDEEELQEEEPVVPIKKSPRARMTRYKEGKGADKRLHLTQLGSEAAEGCRLEIYSNGSEKVWRTLVLPNPWEPETELVICTASEPDAACNVELSGSGYNGNDALVLRCDDGAREGNIVVDRFGRLGEDPGAAWTDADSPEITSKDAELLRCPSNWSALDGDPFAKFSIGEKWVRLGAEEQIEEALQRCPASQNLGGAGGGLE